MAKAELSQRTAHGVIILYPALLRVISSQVELGPDVSI